MSPDRKEIIDACHAVLAERNLGIESQLQALRESLENESKSTAGDKHDTARAMTHLEQGKLGRQELLLSHDLNTLSQLNKHSIPAQVGLGSVVYTPKGTFFIGPSMGKIEVGSITVMVISPVAPIAQSMLGKKAGDEFGFNQFQSVIDGLG